MVFKLLTDRQGEVLRLLCEGNRDREVAEKLGIALASVRNHVAAIRSRTRQPSIPELCRSIEETAGTTAAVARR